jgi:Protein of unknown function (DUF3891)
VFRSRRRPVVFSQADHARFSAAIAAVWGNEQFEQPPLDLASFVRGVALHDRGYGELDADGINEVSDERWIEIQRESFRPRGEDPVVDLVAALHVHRLVSRGRRAEDGALVAGMEQTLVALHEAAGVGEAQARAADSITDLCDRVAFDVCFEEPSAWTRPVLPRVSAPPVEVAFAFDGTGGVTLDPWPLGVPWLRAVLVGFAADGYPECPEPVIEPILLRPA